MNILWDFDGTLFNTYPAYTDILYEVLGSRVSKEEILSHLKISFTHAVKHFGIDEEQVQRILAKEQDLHPANTPPFPYVENILKFSDINVIMTHKPRKEVVYILDYYGWMKYFKEIVAGDDGYPKKPDPSSYIYLHNKYGVDLVIGDREIDIMPAKVIGIKTCLFQNNTPGADMYLTTYEDFFKNLIEV
ncbi:phosphoglycolate phosphatase [Paenibacillus selenitireducens]|uniref:Phosphoglycolate phosphatase n=1 Tax=Paenibacillus selenitireducens TaxID=1324314 RepID=A0A1T2X1P8_9BACL|nr:HAD-IA family hydrolase [Paenibacillus selenitireducens]OPA73811.1 phosphoglycolate phosphatase [Paenibacillus selenitireducens]